MFRRLIRVVLIVLVAPLCLSIACAVSLSPEGVTVSATIGGVTTTVTLGPAGIVVTRADETVLQATALRLFERTPTDRPRTAQMTMPSSSVSVRRLNVGKTLSGMQAQPVNGSATVRFSIAPGQSVDSCDQATFLAEFELVVMNGVVIVVEEEVDLSAAAIAVILTNDITICIAVTADFDGILTMDQFSLSFGLDEAEDTTTASFLFRNDDIENIHFLLPGETFDASNQVSPGSTQSATVADVRIGDSITIRAGRNGVVLDTTTCPTVTGANYSVTVVWDGAGLTCSAGQDGTSDNDNDNDNLNENTNDNANDNTNENANDNTNDNDADNDNDNGGVAAEITFRAVYDRLWDTEDLSQNLVIDDAVMSGDGTKLLWLTHRNDPFARWAVTLNADGTNQNMITLTDDTGGYTGAAIDQDGSRAFFVRDYRYLYKVEGGAVTLIMDRTDHGIAWVSGIQVTTDGQYVYFLDDDVNDNDVWRIGQAGGTPELIIDDVSVTYDNGFPGAQIAQFAIADDGSTIAFTMYGFWGSGGYTARSELFAMNGGTFKQLTSDGATMAKYSPAISGDGSTIVFHRGAGQQWCSIRPDGGSETPLGAAGHNLAGPLLTYDGSRMFYGDTASGGTVLLNTDGSGRLNLVPEWNIGNIAIAATRFLGLSDDGTRVSFFTEYGILPLSAAYSVGYLNSAGAVAGAPRIDSIAFGPSAMPRGVAAPQVIITVQVSDPDGLSDVTNASTDEMVGGVHVSSMVSPIYIPSAAHDDGVLPDATAADGIFTTLAKPGALVDTVNEATVRVSVMDTDKTVVVADAVLPVGP